MTCEDARFSRFVASHEDELRRLQMAGVHLVGAFPEGGALLRKSLAGINASALDSVAYELMERALASNILRGLAAPVLVDVSTAATAYRALGRPEDVAGITDAVLRGRVAFQGTDGVRGPVALLEQGDPVLHFGRTGEITPRFIEVLCWSFGRLARRAGIVRRGGEIVVAEDGRDRATGGRLSGAMKAGLQGAGLTILDLGIAPTPAVPFAEARLGARLGAVLTASHNPASQNGIKFFVDGFKLLPEGGVGDYALSAFAYEAAGDEKRAREEGSVKEVGEVLNDFADFIVKSLPDGAREALAGLKIVFDPANGAFTDVGREVFRRMGLDVESVNDTPSGDNINQGGGVAEVEGRERISAEEAEGSPMLSSVAGMIGRATEEKEDVYGIVMDGDGDRGFVVAAPARRREALVANGDAESYVIARYLRETEAIPDAEASEWEFAGTVESDLELVRHVRESLGLATSINCVGDKWLVGGFRQGHKLAVGQEVSGHVLWPRYTEGPDGSKQAVLTGNGLLTALSALVAARKLGLSADKLARPFEAGTFLTRYTYNVDKALFFRGSRAWRADVKTLETALGEGVGGGFKSWRLIDRDEEADMLYVALEDEEGRVAGAVFSRNSGTENKTGVYARGRKSLEPALSQVCLKLAKIHQLTLKDRRDSGYYVELGVLEAVADGARTPAEVFGELERQAGVDISREAFDTVLYGMRKEGLVEFVGGRIRRAG